MLLFYFLTIKFVFAYQDPRVDSVLIALHPYLNYVEQNEPYFTLIVKLYRLSGCLSMILDNFCFDGHAKALKLLYGRWIRLYADIRKTIDIEELVRQIRNFR